MPARRAGGRQGRTRCRSRDRPLRKLRAGGALVLGAPRPGLDGTDPGSGEHGWTGQVIEQQFPEAVAAAPPVVVWVELRLAAAARADLVGGRARGAVGGQGAG